jgi:transmembrane protein DUF3566
MAQTTRSPEGRRGKPTKVTPPAPSAPAAPLPAADPVAPTGVPVGAPAPAPQSVDGSTVPSRADRTAPPTGRQRGRRRVGTRRTRVMIRQISPWSVLKFSLVFYLCVMLIVYLALVIIYLILTAAGAIDSLERILGELFAQGEISTRGAQPYRINSGVLFTWLFFAGCLMTGVWSLVNVLIAFIYNLISDVIGGIEVTLAQKDRS